MTYILLLIIILLLLYALYRYNYYLNNYYIESFDIEKYKEIMKNNNKKNLYKISLSQNISLDTEDCFKKCNSSDCIKMDSRMKVLDKCLKCNSQENKCFNKSIIGGTCDDCDGVKNEDKIDCLNLQNFGCTNPYNFDDNTGTTPYFIEVPDNNLNSPFNKKCIFCWQFQDNI
jgi:hypothetical protein